METLDLIHHATYLNAFNRRSIFALAPCCTARAAALLVISTTITAYRSRVPVTLAQATAYARDTFKCDCARAIRACDAPGEYL